MNDVREGEFLRSILQYCINTVLLCTNKSVIDVRDVRKD